MSSRVYRPLAALLLGLLLLGGLFAWFTKGPGGDDTPRKFALIYDRCVNSTVEAQRKVGNTDPSFAVSRQCATSPAAYAREFRAFSACVERKIKRLKALPARQIRQTKEYANYEPFTLRRSAESNCSGISHPTKGDLWDDMFWGVVRTTPSGELVQCSEAHVHCPYEEESRPDRQAVIPHITKEMKVKAIMQCTRANVHCPYEAEPTFMRCRASFLDGVQEALVSFRPTRRELQQWAQRAKFECRRKLEG